MKKLLLLLIVMFLHCENSFSQVEIRGVTTIVTDGIPSDSVNLSPNKEFEKRIELKPIDKSDNKIEIRFYKHEELSSTKDLKVLELKGDSWKGTQYSETNYPKVKIKKFDLVAQYGFAELVKMLLQNNLASLPSQKELEPKMKKYVDTIRGRAEQKIQTTDGQSYTVEFKIGDKYRVYTFNNPDTYSSFYDDVQELKDYVVIKNIFETELKRK
ncbi:hypothetical protein [Pontibacter pamirensis]|uniref:hypothetical protein n=1 Tax=Pontibacter pamirensis TaxID=2562824 RepID=UPI00138A67B0|nr:hypothetical protein [Pontibacter pamirensis]